MDHKRIIIADTAPLTDEQGADCTQSCFPPAFRGDALSGDKLEPLAADARKGKDGFRSAWLKIVAGMIGVSPGRIIDRDKKRRAQQRVALALGAVAVGSVIGLTSGIITAYNWRTEMTARGDGLAGQKEALEAAPYALAGLSAPGDIVGVSHANAADVIDRVGARVQIVADLGYPGDVEFSGDGRFMAVRGETALYELAAPLSPRAFGQINDFGFSNDSRYFYTIAVNREATLHDLRQPDRTISIGSTFYGDRNVLFSSNGRFVATKDRDNNGHLYDLNHPAAAVPLGPLRLGDGSLEFSPDGRFLLTLTPELAATLRDLGSGGAPLPLGIVGIDPFSDSERRFLFSPNGKYLATIDDSRRGEVRDLSVSGSRFALGGLLPTFFFSDDSTLLLSSDASANAFLFEVATGDRRVLGAAYAGGFVLGRRYVRLISDRGMSSLIDAQTGAPTPFGEHEEFIPSPSGNFMVTRDQNGVVNTLYDLRNRAAPLRLNAGMDIKFSPDGHFLVGRSLRDDGTLWDLTQAPRATSLGSSFRFWFSADSAFLVARAQDQSSLRNLRTGAVIPLGPINSVTFSENGNLFVGEYPNNQGALRNPSVVASGQGATLRAEICRASANALRPFSQRARTGAEKSRVRLDGRPWNPCDWRGLLAIFPNAELGDGWFEGLRQWVRLTQVRYFGGKDWECAETTSAASAQTRAARARMCELANANATSTSQ